MAVTTRTLNLRSPWSVSHGTSTSREAVFLDLEPGLGEAPIVPYYPYTVPMVHEWLDKVALLVGPATDEAPESVLERIPEGPPPARCALDCALHDRWARLLGIPLAQALGLDTASLPISSISIGIPADDEVLVQALADFPGWPVIKLKLGTGDVERDISIVRTAKRHTTARIMVDANGAWTVGEAVRAIAALAEMGVELVEEPLNSRDPDVWRSLRGQLPGDAPLIMADESIQHAGDVPRLAGAVDAINVKISKAGGLLGARKLITLARKHGMKVLLGCMIETSLGITAAAHLAALADFADLDGHLQLREDPYEGARVEAGRIVLPERPGLGVVAQGQGAGGRGRGRGEAPRSGL